MNPVRFAVWLMIAQSVLFAAETAAIHKIGTTVSCMQLALIRSAGGVSLAFLLARGLRWRVACTRQLALQLLRGGVTLLYMWIMIYSFARLPYADATALSYTQAAYIAVFSMTILGEVVSATRWIAAGIGILGAMLIAQPRFAGWNSMYLIALVGAAINGLAFVLNRYLQRADSEATTMFYTSLVSVVGNIPALFLAGPPAIAALPWLPAVIVLGPLGTFAGIVAVRHATASALGPYTLLRLVIAILGGLVVFRELPTLASGAGALLILGGCALSSGVVPVRIITRLFDTSRMAFAKAAAGRL